MVGVFGLDLGLYDINLLHCVKSFIGGAKVTGSCSHAWSKASYGFVKELVSMPDRSLKFLLSDGWLVDAIIDVGIFHRGFSDSYRNIRASPYHGDIHF